MRRAGVLMLVLLLAGGTLWAQEGVEETLTLHGAALDMIWLVLTAALVFLMQAGFAMVETGLTRAKNAANILMKNLMDFSVGALAFWAIGWALMYGAPSLGGLIGGNGFFLSYSPEALEAYGASSMYDIFRDWMFQVVFAATAATIVSGAMAERTKFTAYLTYSVFVSALIYPTFGHWVWGGGWLSELGFHDFAGSTVVHSIGGWLGLAGAIVLGARKGKYVRVGNEVTVKAIPGHNLPLAALGVFLLWFGWYGFNPGSTLSGSDLSIGHVAVTTTLAAAAGAVLSMITSWLLYGKPDPSMSLNGALAGLVGITAGTWVIGPTGSVIVGAIAGIIVVFSVEFLDKVLHIDDPVGAVSVHGTCGAWGTLAVGLFANGVNDPGIVGLFYGGGWHQLGVQAVGVLAGFAWAFVTGLILFNLIKATIGLRVSEEEELKGLDLSEHAVESYSGFQIFSNM
ncbi:ammonium transporter [Spirochaeta thermophila DSM 6578]|uniref:Ammonium transporter n=1 Tax=Winmispira thermophila (strain ATCC 700085 / DSM 6578 / Z-1203) TaxID=869211 RepID=G0GBN2_WINT7|nr:ammonium transporter [Spirochaeta thermophila]AEJ61110.1 ammonium transporter [Spirochaeta thermophila DSM 6578]